VSTFIEPRTRSTVTVTVKPPSSPGRPSSRRRAVHHDGTIMLLLFAT